MTDPRNDPPQDWDVSPWSWRRWWVLIVVALIFAVAVAGPDWLRMLR